MEVSIRVSSYPDGSPICEFNCPMETTLGALKDRIGFEKDLADTASFFHRWFLEKSGKSTNGESGEGKVEIVFKGCTLLEDSTDIIQTSVDPKKKKVTAENKLQEIGETDNHSNPKFDEIHACNPNIQCYFRRQFADEALVNKVLFCLPSDTLAALPIMAGDEVNISIFRTTSVEDSILFTSTLNHLHIISHAERSRKHTDHLVRMHLFQKMESETLRILEPISVLDKEVHNVSDAVAIVSEKVERVPQLTAALVEPMLLPIITDLATLEAKVDKANKSLRVCLDNQDQIFTRLDSITDAVSRARDEAQQLRSDVFTEFAKIRKSQDEGMALLKALFLQQTRVPGTDSSVTENVFGFIEEEPRTKIMKEEETAFAHIAFGFRKFVATSAASPAAQLAYEILRQKEDDDDGENSPSRKAPTLSNTVARASAFFDITSPYVAVLGVTNSNTTQPKFTPFHFPFAKVSAGNRCLIEWIFIQKGKTSATAGVSVGFADATGSEVQNPQAKWHHQCKEWYGNYTGAYMFHHQTATIYSGAQSMFHCCEHIADPNGGVNSKQGKKQQAHHEAGMRRYALLLDMMNPSLGRPATISVYWSHDGTLTNMQRIRSNTASSLTINGSKTYIPCVSLHNEGDAIVVNRILINKEIPARYAEIDLD